MCHPLHVLMSSLDIDPMLSSHKLKVEIGRWSRIPRENRLCKCNLGIQDEYHIFTCPLVKDIFTKYERSYVCPANLFDNTDYTDLKMLHEILECSYALE